MTASAETLRLYKLGLLCMCGHANVWHAPDWSKWETPDERRKEPDLLIKNGFYKECLGYKCPCTRFDHIGDNLKLCEVLHENRIAEKSSAL